MTKQTLLALSAALVFASGCTRDDATDPDSVEEACEPAGEVVGGPRTGTIDDIDYVVTGGISGEGNGTSLRVQPDGTLIRQTRLGGTQSGKLDQVTLDDLVARAQSAEFATLCHSYVCRNCADEYVDQVSLQVAGTTLKVSASQLAPVPARLRAVIDMLETLVDYPLP
jgi:hypothetical protein